MTNTRRPAVSPGSSAPSAGSSALVLPILTSLIAGACIWAAWLSWGFEDRQYSTFQVLACGVTAVVVAVVLTVLFRASRPVVSVAIPLCLGITSAWTAWAAGDDETGLYLVGTIMMLVGTGVSFIVIEMVTRALLNRRVD